MDHFRSFYGNIAAFYSLDRAATALAVSIAIGVGAALEAFAGAYVLQRRAKVPHHPFDRISDVLLFVLLSAFASCLINATIGTTSVTIGGFAPAANYGITWLTWWFGDAMGVAIFAPVILIWRRWPKIKITVEYLIEIGVLTMLLLLAALVAFDTGYPLEYALIPVMIVIVFRFGQYGGSASVLLVSGISIIGVVRGASTFSRSDINVSLLLLQTFIATISLTMLVLAAALSERQRAEAKLGNYNRELELRINERTLELYRTKEHVEAILNNSSDAILVVRADGTISQINPIFSDLFGYQPDEVITRPLKAFIEPAHIEQLMSALASTMAGGTSQRIEVEACRKDETVFNADVGLSPITRHGNMASSVGTPEVVCSIRDITASKQVERELQELNKLKTEFLSTAAHELRTPLASILGFSEILVTRDLPPERGKRYMQIIHEQSVQLHKIINALLDISRLESGQTMVLESQSVNMTELFTKTLAYFAQHLPNYQFQIEGVDECPAIIGDQLRLGEVLQNLLSNAVKYSPNGGTITVRGQVIPGFIEISIQDKGIGMTAQQQAHLFERFYRADASSTTISGTGLGLVICKLIIELHGGQIWAESASGRGTTMHFKLPLGSS
ncbi:MAG: sensor histidine kinase [Aggregatilineales bacterium]